MLDTSPRVILVQNIGLFSVGESLGAAKIAGDLTETNARVISSVEETSKYKFIPEKDIFDIEYWSLEQAKINKTKKFLQVMSLLLLGVLVELVLKLINYSKVMVPKLFYLIIILKI